MILLLVVQESNLDGATTTIDSEGLWGLRIIASVVNANAKEPWKRMVAIEEKKNELWHFWDEEKADRHRETFSRKNQSKPHLWLLLWPK